ncbi:TPA: O176 family O-antigen polymerase, partial [Escherichia coli]
NMLGNNGYATLLHVLAPFLSICLIAVMIFFYIKRASFISLQLMYAFAFSLIIGVPGIYLLNFRNPVKGFEIVCLWAILLNIVLYFCSYNNKTITQRKKVNKYFVVIFVIVGICQLIKTGLYFIFIVNSGVGHLAIYTEGDALVSQVPFVIRAISGMSLIMS